MITIASKANSLIHNISWTFTSNVVYAICQWGILILLVKMGSVQMAGHFTYALALVSPVYLFFGLHLRAVISTDVQLKYKFHHYFYTRLGTSVIGALIFLLIWFVPSFTIELKLVILLMSLNKLVESLSDIYHGLYQLEERMDTIGKSLLLKGPLLLLVVICSLAFTHNLITVLISQLIVSILLYCLYDRRIAIKSGLMTIEYESIDPKPVIKLAKESLPLGILMILISLNSNVSRYFIEYNLGLIIVGYYSTISYFKIAGHTFINAMGQSVSSRLARYYLVNDNKLFIKLTFKLILATIGLSITALVLVVLVGEPLLVLVYDDSYRDYSYLFILIVISAAIEYLSSILGYCIMSCRSFNIMPLNFTLLISVNIVSCILLIPNYGIAGAAYAAILTGIVNMTTNLIILIVLLLKRNHSADIGVDVAHE